ncbi:MAG: riboflavin synthase, partial [Kiritimatiellae bacterium]|nr:riboflavin synthase [Kiritimatiellia bacterium]
CAPFPEPDPLAPGESVAVQGACLTVAALTPCGFEADILDETMRRTALGSLPIGAPLNLERAMKAGSRVGGHIVQGPVDEVGTVDGVRRVGRDIAIEVECTAGFAALCVEKGSVAIDGVSLTITAVGAETFTVNVIPHTLSVTSLARLSSGARVNLEADVIGKYVARALAVRGVGAGAGMGGSGGLTEDVLRKAGFDV